jgi:uncharacterized protein (UPF0147 family)
MARLEVAVIDREGDAMVVNAARPLTLVAFEDAHEGKSMPQTVREVAWMVHHALAIEQPLDEWLATLEDVSADPDVVALARRIIDGDEQAKRQALGEEPPAAEPEHEEGGNERPPPESDPAVEQLTEAASGGAP